VPVVGSRFLIEAGFIIAVAVVAGIERLSTWWIIAVVAAAWIVVAIVEIVLWARQDAARKAAAAAPAEPVLAARSNAHSATVRPEPPPARRPKPEPIWEPPRVAAVPSPPPEPEPEPEPVARPEPVPETATVLAFTPVNDAPREWNLWELERAARDHVDDDVAQAEERSYLLLYLREFAGPDGVLPADFDGLVRDAFGDVLHTVGA
jgi:outer membrane biosynthesis protein TonB